MDSSSQSFALNALQSINRDADSNFGNEKRVSVDSAMQYSPSNARSNAAEDAVDFSTPPGLTDTARVNQNNNNNSFPSIPVSKPTTIFRQAAEDNSVPVLLPASSLPSTGLNTLTRSCSPSLIALPIPQLPPPEKHSYDSSKTSPRVIGSPVDSFSPLPIRSPTTVSTPLTSDRSRSRSRSLSPLRNTMSTNHEDTAINPPRGPTRGTTRNARSTKSPVRGHNKAQRDSQKTVSSSLTTSTELTNSIPAWATFGSGMIFAFFLSALQPTLTAFFARSLEVTGNVIQFALVWGFIFGAAYLIYYSSSAYSWGGTTKKVKRRSHLDISGREYVRRNSLEAEDGQHQKSSDFISGSYGSSSRPQSPSKDEIYAYRPYPSRTHSAQPLEHPGHMRYRRGSKSSSTQSLFIPSPTLSTGSSMDSVQIPETPPQVGYVEQDTQLNSILSGDDLTMELEKSPSQLAFKLH